MENATSASVGDVVAAIDDVVPLSKAGGWDPVGLQVGDGSAVVRRVAVCHEATDAVIDAARDSAADLLVAYHPLLFRPAAHFVAGPTPAGRAFRLASHGIALVVVHTAYDVAEGGVADALAEALELVDTTPFGPNYGADSVKIVTFVPEGSETAVIDAMSAAGAGVMGQYSKAAFRSTGHGSFAASDAASPAIGAAGEESLVAETRIEMLAPKRRSVAVAAALAAAHPYEEPPYDIYDVTGNAGFIGRRGRIAEATTLGEFGDHVSDRLGSVVRIAGDRSRSVDSVSVIPGSGRSFVSAAGPNDVVVTGDIGHHDARSAVERGQAIVDPGHAASERPGMARLYSLVGRIVAEIGPSGGSISVDDLTAIDPDPWSDTWRR